MPIKKWVGEGMVTLLFLFVLFNLVQLFKGHDIFYAIKFGLLWSVISIAIFYATRIYYYKKGMACKVCDLPTDESRNN